MNKPFSTRVSRNNEIILHQNFPITFHGGKISEFVSYVLSGLGIFSASFNKEKPLLGSEEEIIQQIHKERFDPSNPYVITGGHFHQLYVRNLGIFYNALLDSRIQMGEKDWENRQRITLQTLALDLEVFHLAKKTYTTIVPITATHYTAMNVRTTPSDQLFAIVYTLCALTDQTFISSIFPTQKNTKSYSLQTVTVGKKLLNKYAKDLQTLLLSYKQYLLDPITGIIRKDMYLASAMDGVKRESGFYDNVILWATYRLAEKLKIITISEKELHYWKERIIKTFWDEKEGIFIDDLSLFAQKEKLFAADSFIVTSTQFLDITNPKERVMLEKIVAYIQKNNMDKPFPILFTKESYKQRMYFLVKHFVPEYMGTGVWSHWGIEYIKLLVMLGKYNTTYCNEARKQLESYTKNIEKNKGFPELCDENGNVYKKLAYRAVLRNGWVINYEQAKMMAENIK